VFCLNWMVASIYFIKYATNFFVNAILIKNVVQKYFNFDTFSKDLLTKI